MGRRSRTAMLFLGLTLGLSPVTAEPAYRSHPPMRPLPSASSRPAGQGPSYFVDPAKGDDRQDGSRDKPWKTVSHAVQKLKPGDTLYLRAGRYYGGVVLSASGTAEAPITVRAFPGEL